MRFRSENPIYKRMDYSTGSTEYGATYMGVGLKTMFMLLITAAVAFYMMTTTTLQMSLGTLISSLIVAPILGYVMVLLAHRNEQLSFVFATLYALFEGVFLGIITLLVSYQIGNVGVMYAILGTFGSMFAMLLIYSTGIVKVGEGFKSFLLSALISLIIVSLVFYLFFYTGALNSTYGLGIYTTIIIVSIVLSCLYLIYDFNRISEYVNGGADKSSEWSLGLGLMVTLVWLYIDLLRLILIFTRSD